MKILKNKTMAILIAAVLTLSMGAPMMLTVSAHTPAWNIPTYAYITATPNPIGVGQTMQVYMWLDMVYGAAGGSSAAISTNGSTASAALLSNSWRFHNYNLTIVAPNGTPTTTIFANIIDSTSSQETGFTPSTTGVYTLIFTFPGQVYGANGDGYEKSSIFGDSYTPSSASTTVTVQSAPIPAAITSEPLPTAYWTHPIYGENTNWYSISSNWLGSGSAGYSGSVGPTELFYHPDGVGPLTSHVMWTQPMEMGGIVGGEFGVSAQQTTIFAPASQGVGYFEGSAYEQRFVNPIVVNGYLFFTEPVSFSEPSGGATVCENLQTGQIVWSSTQIPSLSFAYIYNLWDPDEHGVFPPILFTSSFARAFDAYTGTPLFNVTGVPTGTSVAGPSGEQLRYVMTNIGTTANPNWYLSEWNSSKIWQYDINPYTGSGSLVPSIVNASNGLLTSTYPIPITGGSGTLPPGAPAGTSSAVPYNSALTVNANIPMNSNALAQGSTTTAIKTINQDSLTTYDWNISIGWHNSMAVAPSIIAASYDDILLCRNGTLSGGYAATGTGTPQTPFTYFAVDVNPAHSTFGQVLWMQTYQPPAGNLTVVQGPVDFQSNVFMLNYRETLQWVGYSMTTGNQIWGPSTPQAAFDYYGSPGPGTLAGEAANGLLYSSSFSGICYAYNDLTGKLVWTYGNGGADNSTNAGLNTFYGDYPSFIMAIGNGVIYDVTVEHTITDPIYKGATAEALNATTGKELWKLSAYVSGSFTGTSFAIADGYAVFFNGYDDQIYSVGQGPSATTVTAPDVGVSTTAPIVIKGSVLDVSAGTQQTQTKGDFPYGVPCASDASMQDWMGYVYQQQSEPTTFTGVPVQISVLDSNGNYRVIGKATTDQSGTYSLTWTPDISGNYTIYANFLGTNGYYPSSAETHIYANPAGATPAPTLAPVSGLATQSTVEYIGIAIIIVIIIIGAVIMLVLRRKP